MASQKRLSVPGWIRSWTTTVPVLAVVVLVLSWGRSLPTPGGGGGPLGRGGGGVGAPHLAGWVPPRVGEPLGSLVLAVAVTVIEVGLIVTLMVSGKGDTSTL